ncbi:hypothetical protein GOP47_0004129 [Adiantum capillus-veneris]|uniref:Uncharacterized protein n=1 Tax=Adiantum capillus-veneris TaxID=13818 RepID=A0A9D4V831_ADICA|nr:hypothetical protein GOP47_0004129 [Adiantum capillus-veneris]
MKIWPKCFAYIGKGIHSIPSWIILDDNNPILEIPQVHLFDPASLKGSETLFSKKTGFILRLKGCKEPTFKLYMGIGINLLLGTTKAFANDIQTSHHLYI